MSFPFSPFNLFLFAPKQKPYNSYISCLQMFAKDTATKIITKLFPKPLTPHILYTQFKNYVNVYMKWKKDSFFETLEHIHSSPELKRIVSLKNVINQNPNACIPISDVSKRGLEFDVKIKVARFLRKYPSIFEEFVGPKYGLPWFRLTREAVELDEEERRVFKECKEDLVLRLKKFVLMSKEKVLPFKIVRGMSWYLGLPEDFLDFWDKNLGGSFKSVGLDDGLRGLAVESGERIFSVLQSNGVKKGVYFGKPMEPMGIPIFPSKGLRLRRKIEDWLKEFQMVPYVSPYEDCLDIDTDSDIAEKRVVGFLHELLCLFVDHSAERKKLLCLKKYFGLPQKVHRAFERHPHVFYMSFRNNTCTVILKEAYRDESAVEAHPMLRVRKKYVDLMMKSEVILKQKRMNNRFSGSQTLDAMQEMPYEKDLVAE